MIPFHNSFENNMHLSKHTCYWNFSSRYIPLFLMCFGILSASTIISPCCFSPHSHSLCTGLLFFWTKWDGQPVSEAHLLCSLDFPVDHDTRPFLHLTWESVFSAECCCY